MVGIMKIRRLTVILPKFDQNAEMGAKLAPSRVYGLLYCPLQLRLAVFLSKQEPTISFYQDLQKSSPKKRKSTAGKLEKFIY